MSAARAAVIGLAALLMSVALVSIGHAGERTALLPFKNTPFPYNGKIPDSDKPFLDLDDGERRGHTSARGGVYWEHPTYSDRRVLIAVPPRFDLHQPALIVVYLHGNQATLERDVRDRQKVPQQLAHSGINAILVAPQFAVDAIDSSAGGFWRRGMFSNFLDETADQVARLQGDSRLRAVLRRARVLIVAYSGGYQAAAFALDVGGADHRIAGVVLLDALYGQEERYANWIARHRRDAFFFSTYTEPARDSNEALQRMLSKRGVPFSFVFPRKLQAGGITFRPLNPYVIHGDLVTQSWMKEPLADLLHLVAGYVHPPATAKPAASSKAPKK